MRRSGVLGFLGIERRKERLNDTWLSLVQINRTADFDATMSRQWIRRHAGGAQELVHLHPTTAHCQLDNRPHICPEGHLHLPVMTMVLRVAKLDVWEPDISIKILFIPALKCSIFNDIPRIASMIKISFQIHWQMKKHPLVSLLWAVR